MQKVCYIVICALLNMSGYVLCSVWKMQQLIEFDCKHRQPIAAVTAIYDVRNSTTFIEVDICWFCMFVVLDTLYLNLLNERQFISQFCRISCIQLGRVAVVGHHAEQAVSDVKSRQPILRELHHLRVRTLTCWNDQGEFRIYGSLFFLSLITLEC